MFIILAIIAIVVLLGTVMLKATSTTNSANLDGRAGYAYIPMPAKASEVFKRGAHVMTVSGLLRVLADTSLGVYAGRVQEADVTAVAVDGTTKVLVAPPENERYQQFDASGADNTWINLVAAVGADDHTAVLNASSTNHVVLGRVKQVLSATKIVVDTADRPAITTSGG